MATTNIYLNFDGNCQEVFDFYKTVFGGEFNYIGRFSDMPKSEDYSIPEADLNKIMHIGLPIGTSLLMGSDIGGDWAPTYVQGNNFSVSVNAESKEEADKIFNTLSQGGEITMELQMTFWGDYFGMLIDKFGINWMISYNDNSQK